MKECRRTESRVLVVRTDLLGQNSPSISQVGALSLVSSITLGLGGEVNDLPTRLVDTTDGRPSTNFFFISSFSLWRAWISCSLLCFSSSAQPSLSTETTTTSFGQLRSSSRLSCYGLILSTSVFFSISLDPRWAPIVLIWGLGPRELLRGFFYLFLSVDRTILKLPSLQTPRFFFLASSLGLLVIKARRVPVEGTPTLKSAKTYLILGIYVIYSTFGGLSLLGQVKELDNI